MLWHRIGALLSKNHIAAAMLGDANNIRPNRRVLKQLDPVLAAKTLLDVDIVEQIALLIDSDLVVIAELRHILSRVGTAGTLVDQRFVPNAVLFDVGSTRILDRKSVV